jgi:DNA-binding NarL/FixJ family response regulator
MHPDFVVATGLRAVLSAQDEFRVEGADSASACAAAIIVTDHAGGIDLAARRVRKECIPAILVVSQRDREWDVRTALDSGVQGYLLQSAGQDEIVRALRQIGRGECFVSDALLKVTAQSLQRDALTRREADVLQLLAEGCCNKLIARRLGIGVGTVKSHVANLMGKLDVHARTHAVVVAAQRGLITPHG